MTPSEATSLLWDCARLHGRGDATDAALRQAQRNALTAGVTPRECARNISYGTAWGRSEKEDER